jgi:hypothetical protein
MIIIANLIILLFGLFFIGVSFLMLFSPERARRILRKTGSTNFINYTEITLRLIPAAALVVAAAETKFPDLFTLAGWFMLFTSLVLYVVPRRLHHAFSLRAADFLKPVYVQLIAPFAFVIGAVVVYSVM